MHAFSHSLSEPLSPGEWSLPLMGVVGSRYQYTSDLLALEACIPPTLRQPVSWPVYQSPIIMHNLVPFLRRHPDQEFARYIYDGFTHGFRIGFNWDRTRLRSRLRNHPSSSENPIVLRGNIHNEVAFGRMVGPLPMMWNSVVHCSPLGLVPKSQPGKWRTIVDLSCPSGGSIREAR